MPSERTPLIQTVNVNQRPPRYTHSTFRRFCTLALASIVIFAILCAVIPIATVNHRSRAGSYLPWSTPYRKTSWPASTGLSFDKLRGILLDTPDEDRAREWSKYYTAGPHLAGKNLSQAIWTRDRWQEMGVMSDIVSYDVYINYPGHHRLALLHNRKVKYEFILEDDILEEYPSTSLNDRIPTFHGYSASGNVTAPYVYVNFGTYQDFEDLRAANISLKNKIALAKYGKIFRGLKVKRAQELGMVGVVIYTDPQEDGEITEVNGFETYPNGPARNPSSVQRGSTQFISSLPAHKLTLTDRRRRHPPRRSYHTRLPFQTGCATRRSTLFHPPDSVSTDILPRRIADSQSSEWLWSKRKLIQRILARRRIGISRR